LISVADGTRDETILHPKQNYSFGDQAFPAPSVVVA
jgi:hypothetical protein